MNDAYTAGIIDGEGTITIANQDGYYYLRVNVTMSDKGYRVLDFLHREYGGMMGKERPSSGNTRASKQWRVSNGDAARVINSVLNHLRLKREQALVALQLWDLIEEAPKKSNGRTEWSDSMKASAEVLKRRIGELNARGVNGSEAQVVHEGAVAVWKYGEWHEPEDDLFGPVPFKGRLPVSGSMRNGVAYELPMSGHRTVGSEYLFSQPGGKLLPTPNTMEHLPARTGEARERQLRRGEGPGASRRQSMGNLREDIVEVEPGEWGPYAAAISRWESVLGRPAPAPTEEGPKGGRRLSAAFVEWMMGLPEGWVTGHGLPLTAELKMLGNGVVPQQAITALREMVS